MSATALPVRTHQVGLLGFLATAIMLFTAFTAALIIRRSGPDWQPIALPPLVFINTVVLVTSSVTMEAARRGRAARWLRVTALLGVLFALGQVQVWREMRAAGMFLASNPHSSFFHVLTGVHGAHLAGGLLALSFVARRLAARIDLAATYWHFLGAAWVYVLLVVTLL